MNTKTPITISGNEYQIGFSFRAIDMFEQMTGKSVQEVTRTLDNAKYCYCTLKALNPEFELTFDQFIDILDAEPELLIAMQTATSENAESETEREAIEVNKKKGLLKPLSVLWTLSLLLWVLPVLIPIIFGIILIFGSLKALYQYIVKRGSKRASSPHASPVKP